MVNYPTMLALNRPHSPSTTVDLPRAFEEQPHSHATINRFEFDRTDPLKNTPGAAPTPHPSSPIANAPIFSDPKVIQTLLIDYLAGYTASRLCASYNITLPQLFAWRRSPETQQLLREHEEFAAEQARHVQYDKEPEIILTLCAIATRGTSETESRRAASDLLRAFKFRDYLAHRVIRNPAASNPKPRTLATESDNQPSGTSSDPSDPSGLFNPPSHKTPPDKSNTSAPIPIPRESGDALQPDRADRFEPRVERVFERHPRSANAESPHAESVQLKPPIFAVAATPPHNPPKKMSDEVSSHRLSGAMTEGVSEVPALESSPRSINSQEETDSVTTPSAISLRDLRALRGSISPDIESQILTLPAPVRAHPATDPAPGFPLCLTIKPAAQPPTFEEMLLFMPPPPKNFNPYWPESDIFYLCFPGRSDKQNLRSAIASHQEMLARTGAQALVNHHHFSPGQQSQEAHAAAIDFYQHLARKNPPPDH